MEEKEKNLRLMLDEVQKFTNEKDVFIAIAYGIKDEDVIEFTKEIKKLKSNNEDDLIQLLVDFRNYKRYKNDDCLEKRP